MDHPLEPLKSLKEQHARAERNAERFRLLGDQERYMEWYLLCESLGTQLDALARNERPAGR